MKAAGERASVAGLGVAMLILAFIGWYSYRSINELIAASRWVSHTNQSLRVISHVLSRLRDAEAGQRGYIITGDERYLESWRSAAAVVNQDLRELRSLTADHPAQQRRLDQLDVLVAGKLRNLEEMIEERRRQGPQSAAPLLLADRGRGLAEEIRRTIREMEGEESGLLAQRTAQEEATAKAAENVILFGSLLAFGLVMLAAGIAYRELARRRQAEEGMRRYAAEIEDLYNHAPCGYHSLDGDGVFVRVNDTELKWLGYARDEMVGKLKFADVVTPAGRQAFGDSYPRFQERGYVSDLEFELVRKDGTTFPVSLSATAVRGADGRYVMSRSTLFDITERRKAADLMRHLNDELELRVRERTAELAAANRNLQAEVAERRRAEERIAAIAERYRVVFESNPLPMWVYDPETLAFLTVNEEAVRHYGWTREEFLGLTIKDLCPADDAPELSHEITPPAGEGDLPCQTRHRTKDGGVIEVEAFSHDITLSGRRARMVIARDITEKKRLEANLRRAQRLEGIGTLAGGIAHDLNNILSPILLAVDVLQTKVADAGSRRMLEILTTNAQRGSDLVRQVLTFARGAAGERAAFSPAPLVRELVKTLRHAFPKTIEITSALPADLWGLSGDATQIHQVLMNLCVNARDAMPQGGELTVTAENVVVDEAYARLHHDARPGRYVRLTVSDTGSGIPPELVPQIFDPFFTTKEVGQGTGLGLATVAAIVRNHGGFLEVSSVPGRGTAFKICLPAAEAGAVPAAEPAAAGAPEGRGELILVVDDEVGILEIARATLESHGYRALTAQDGTEAVALAAEHRGEIRAVLTDLAMPFLDGIATARALRRLDPQLPILAASGLADARKLAEAGRVGISAVLAKPFTAEKLLRALAEHIRPRGTAE
jgi:two-component system, cell cycle sensor histidine kinase and response regulator CckA